MGDAGLTFNEPITVPHYSREGVPVPIGAVERPLTPKVCAEGGGGDDRMGETSLGDIRR